ncbi:MAG: FliM/FliN family flagellar motor switch protein, partial [Methyloligellaceae bacterium]
LVKRMMEVILDDMVTAFSPLSPVKFELERLETNPRFAAISRPANAAILIRLRIDMEDRGGKIEVLLPYSTLEPIRELLLQGFMGEKFGRDNIWESHLSTEIWSTKIDIDVVLDELKLPLEQLMNLKIGETVMLHCGPQDKVTLRSGGIPLVKGAMGRSGDQVAIQVNSGLKKLQASQLPQVENKPVSDPVQ